MLTYTDDARFNCCHVLLMLSFGTSRKTISAAQFMQYMMVVTTASANEQKA